MIDLHYIYYLLCAQNGFGSSIKPQQIKYIVPGIEIIEHTDIADFAKKAEEILVCTMYNPILTSSCIMICANFFPCFFLLKGPINLGVCLVGGFGKETMGNSGGNSGGNFIL
jgi:hypothetical protein